MTGVDARVSARVSPPPYEASPPSSDNLSLSCQRTEAMPHKEEEEGKRIVCFLDSYSR